MNFLEFIISFLWLVSFDLGFGFLIYTLWKYVDYKYFSAFEISILREENSYLKKENQKLNGSSTDFWTEEEIK